MAADMSGLDTIILQPAQDTARPHRHANCKQQKRTDGCSDGEKIVRFHGCAMAIK